MKKHSPFVFLALTVVASAQVQDFRPPAVPLITHDPYFSVWSMADSLASDVTRHWTGTPQPLTSLVRVDGVTYVLMGSRPVQSRLMPQTRLQVLPTRTIYEFEGGGIRLTLTFLTPALPDDLDVLGRPVTYLTWDVQSISGEHDVSIYFDVSSHLAVNTVDQPVVWSRFKLGSLTALRMGSQQQPVLEKNGDNLRIDWGYLYAASAGEGVSSAATDGRKAGLLFQKTGRLPDSDDVMDELSEHRRRRHAPVMAFVFDLGKTVRLASRHLMLAYDDIFSLEYLDRRLRPYWRRNGSDVTRLLPAAWLDYEAIERRSRAFDEELMADLARAGGREYAQLGALAYRQTLAGNKLAAAADGAPLMFPKENFSNGCIGTVDVIYPSAPFFLLFNPELLKAQLRPVFEYAGLPRWRFPFAPHDLGTYPHANGQVYGGGEETEEGQMPVEESGNMLIMTAALARVEGNARFAAPYWALLSRWAAYLKEKGMDPENQLATNDMSGRLAHNTDLSIKAIIGLGAYGQLCELSGKREEALEYTGLARQYAAKWEAMANDGDHYRMAFDRPGTWSQKHNLIWDKVLGLNLFKPDVSRKEIVFYRSRMNSYGLPFDNRESYTLLDWSVWTAALADSKGVFESFIVPIYRFAHESPSRVPLTDWYRTQDAKQQGFQARPVVGGIFIQMLSDRTTWERWAGRARGSHQLQN